MYGCIKREPVAPNSNSHLDSSCQQQDSSCWQMQAEAPAPVALSTTPNQIYNSTGVNDVPHIERQQQLPQKPQQRQSSQHTWPALLEPFAPLSSQGELGFSQNDVDFLNVFDESTADQNYDHDDGDDTDQESESSDEQKVEVKQYCRNAAPTSIDLQTAPAPPAVDPVGPNFSATGHGLAPAEVSLPAQPLVSNGPATATTNAPIRIGSLSDQVLESIVEVNDTKPSSTSSLLQNQVANPKTASVDDLALIQWVLPSSVPTRSTPSSLMASNSTSVPSTGTKAKKIKKRSKKVCKNKKRKSIRPSPEACPERTAIPTVQSDSENVPLGVVSACDTKIPSIRKTNTSLEIFNQFVKRSVLPDGTTICDASGILSRPSFDLWLKTRRKPPKNPFEAFRKTLIARITVADERSLPFEEDVERSLLENLRQRKIWPCFENQFHKEKPVVIGINGLRAVGFHERSKQEAEAQLQAKPSVSTSSTALLKKRKPCAQLVANSRRVKRQQTSAIV